MLNKNPHVCSLQFLSLKPTILNSEFIGAAFILKFLRARLACYKNIQIRIIKKKWLNDFSRKIIKSTKDATYPLPVNPAWVINVLVFEKKINKRTRFNDHCVRNICRSKEVCHDHVKSNVAIAK